MGLLKTLIEFVMKLLGMKSEPEALPAAGHHAHASSAHGSSGSSADDDAEASKPRGQFKPVASDAPFTADTRRGFFHNDQEFDIAGFDPERDEEAFFEAVLYMDSEGMIAPNVIITEENHAETEKKFAIRDREHWQTVRDSCWAVLGHKYGGRQTEGDALVSDTNAAMQANINWRQGFTQKLMQGTAKAKAANGELNPVEGISLEQWAALNAAIAQGMSLEDMLKGQGIDMARWDKARAEWEARMSRDTTFTIAQIYGNAFQAASKGKYSEFAKEANAARTANRDLGKQPPMTLEAYWEILYEQAYGAKQGKDPVETLKGVGLSVVDWCDLSAFMGYHIQRTYMQNSKQYTDTMKKVEAKYEAKYPGVKADVDIAF